MIYLLSAVDAVTEQSCAAGAETPVIATEQLLSMFGSLIAVVALLLVLGWCFKKLQPGMQRGPAKVLAQQYIGPKEKLLVIQVAGEYLLLGSSPAGLQLIKTLNAEQLQDWLSPQPSALSQGLDVSKWFGKKQS